MHASAAYSACARCIDVLVAAVALVALTPLVFALALWIRRDCAGPVFYSEERLGQHGRPFRIHKLRTLRAGSSREPRVAVGDDPRITRSGRVLRRLRLDELPQFWDVLRGAMSLIGPRPYVPDNLAMVAPAVRARLFAHRPGLTGPSAVAFLGEDEVLATVADAAGAYRRVLVPAKVRLDLAALARRSVCADAGWLWRTVCCLGSQRARTRSGERVRAVLRRRGVAVAPPCRS